MLALKMLASEMIALKKNCGLAKVRPG